MPTIIEITAGQVRFSGAYSFPLQLAALVLLLLLATAVDVRERRIPNRLVAIGIAGGIAFHAVSRSASLRFYPCTPSASWGPATSS
jgi:Flp pilus assembly protein protease CpaA